MQVKVVRKFFEKALLNVIHENFESEYHLLQTVAY